METSHLSLIKLIFFKYDHSETIYQDRELPSSDSLATWAGIGETDADAKVDLYAAFGYDAKDFMECNAQRPGAQCDARGCTCWSTKGVAYVGGACTDYLKTSMNEYSLTTAETALVHKISRLP